jgi:hypothetical protein
MIEDTWRTVLLVDQEGDAAGGSIGSALAASGYDTVPADASSAVQLARILRPSAVVMCVELDLATRLAVEIRALEDLAEVFVVAVGAARTLRGIDRCVAATEVADVVAEFERGRVQSS